MTNDRLFIERMPTPTGTMRIVTDAQDQLRALEWEDCGDRHERLLRRLETQGEKSAARLALEAYFAGGLAAIATLNVKTGGTEFQRLVWAALRAIPAGATASYARIAENIGRPKAVRAVGMANHVNPVCIVVPCHRVIGADGSLTGYGGGLERKLWLLRHEGAPVWRHSSESAAKRL